jgi:flavin reductase (DIM6/NTAB) family NADH-FMN oxidoreductase RutF
MECELIRTVDFPNHDIFIGKVVATHCDESVLTDGVVDLVKVQPILFAMYNQSYWGIGENLAKAWSIGKDLCK